MNKKLIIFGPWCGEFCYELSWWIPEIRKKRYEDFKDYDAIAIGPEGRKVLYKDFTEQYISFPKELENTLMYPATFGEHVNGRDIIPDNLKRFVHQVATQNHTSGGYDRVEVYLPGTMPITQKRTRSEQPYGIYRHFNASAEIIKSVQEEIQFDNDRETIAVMARIRNRKGKTCYLDWNPKHWKTFINSLIEDLKVNIVMIGIAQKDGSSAGASLTFDNSKFIKSIVFEGEDSVERQIALLKLTKCSIYGASGTAVFPFFVKGAATFTQQTTTEGFRLKFQWERDLTDNLKNVEIYDDNENYKVYDACPEDLYQRFKKFYQGLLV